MPLSPTFNRERAYWEQDILRVAGVDEAGMGALAGPVVAGAVMFSHKNADELVRQSDVAIRDSKTLSASQRERAREWIMEHARWWSVGEATVEEITELNIRNAARLAMERAIGGLDALPDIALVDGTNDQPHPRVFSENVVKGDSVSVSIAAASILAKVHRDAILIALDEHHPEYGFASHKGYGSKQHMDALQTHGASAHHRTAYAPVAKVLE